MTLLYVDVDDTLVLWQPYASEGAQEYLGDLYTVNEPLLEGVKRYATEYPGTVVIWSGGGKQYAVTWADRLGLLDLGVVSATKDLMGLRQVNSEEDVVIDDQPVLNRTHGPHDWPETTDSGGDGG